MKEQPASTAIPGFALEILATDRVGLMADIMNLISGQSLSARYIQSWNDFDDMTHTTIQIQSDQNGDTLIERIRGIPSVQSVQIRPTNLRTYGKRVIVLGGGAQVAAVASGAIVEADRHNIRGELISVDTIAVVGESEIAQAVRAVGRLHRAGILVLAGALMGGEIRNAVQELREVYGIPVVALKMAGSVVEVVDLVVTDPTEAGVMAVMLLSSIGKFNLLRVHGEEF
jgi:energy-converting hydrogenase B subunit Q